MHTTDIDTIIGFGFTPDFGRLVPAAPSVFSSLAKTNVAVAYFTEIRERYVGIDLDYFRSHMTPYEYMSFTDFIGGEALGFVPEDFEEIYYPEDEDQ